MATTVAGSCADSPTCTIAGGGAYVEWAPKAYSERDKTGTIVVVQIINTVLDTTSYSTIAEAIPSNYVPPLTNAAGTKIAVHTYTRHGRAATTTVTYPTPFLQFDNTFTIAGTYQLSDKCIVANNPNKTFPILPNPQPAFAFNDPKWNLSLYFDTNDPLGWSHSWSGGKDGNSVIARTHILSLIDLLPDDNPEMPHSVAKKCKAAPFGSPAVAVALPNWKVVAHTSVVYEGGGKAQGTALTGTKGGSAKTSDGLGTAAKGSSSTGVAQVGGGKATASPKSPGGGNSSQRSGGSPTGRPNDSSGNKNVKAAWPLWAVVSMGALVALSAGL